MEQNKSLSTQEVANILHVSKSTIYELIRKGEITSYKIGRKVRFTQEDVDAYIGRSRHSQRVTSPVKKTSVQSTLLRGEPNPEPPLIIAGQDVILDLLSNHLHQNGISSVRAYLGSFESILALYQDHVHIATSHLWDSDSNLYNLPYVRRLMPGTHAVIVNLSYRMQGFYVLKGNPKNIHTWEDLIRPDVTILNRKKGSGSRILLDEHLFSLGLLPNQIRGYETEVPSHLTAATAIAEGQADVSIGTRRVTKQFPDLEFIPMQREQCDLIIKKELFNTSKIQTLLQILRSDIYQKEVHAIADNDYSDLGKIVGEV
ncbi:MAG: helix-turn-helix transcriptional regulator [Lachnospiraceae bacterium]|nr:helix-turn-helix transcriptional regulator [Lachnospiraceae bacterium]